MATIDDLWDEPIESEPAPPLATKPVTSEDPLFLQSDSDNEGAGAARQSTSRAPDDIETLFDVDDDDENGQLSNVTYEQLRKDAQLDDKVVDDGTPNQGDQGTEKGVSTAKSQSNKKGDGEGTKRTIPKLDEELLLSGKGIPALIKDARRWQPKGKGHEISDLNRLIRMYQYWAHQMYPRHTFNDTIERVEKLTHSRRMHVALGGWHDEARGISRHQAPPDESIDIDGIDSDREQGRVEPPGSRQSSEPPTRPPSSASERGSGPDYDFRKACVAGTESTRAQEARDEFDFEVEMWDDTPFTDGLTSASADPTKSTINPQTLPTKSPAPSSNQDEDEDMWDLVDELQTRAGPNENTIPPEKPPAPVDDDDWDDMYA